jgi:hypothetical protein
VLPVFAIFAIIITAIVSQFKLGHGQLHICYFKELKIGIFTGRLTKPQKHSTAVTVVDILT